MATDGSKKEKGITESAAGSVSSLSKTANLSLKTSAFRFGLTYLGQDLPNIKAKLTFIDNDKKVIKVDDVVTDKKTGLCSYPNPPTKKVLIDYYDCDDNFAKCIAFHTRKALKEKSAKDLYHVLCNSPKTMAAVVESYNKYSSVWGGSDFAKDVYDSNLIEKEPLDILFKIIKLPPLNKQSKLRLLPIPKVEELHKNPFGSAYINASPKLHSILKKTPVTYKLSAPPPHLDPHIKKPWFSWGNQYWGYEYEPSSFKHQWYCFNDPSKVKSGEIKNPVMKGPDSEEWMFTDRFWTWLFKKEYNWTDFGHQRLVCRVETKNGTPDDNLYPTMRRSNIPDPRVHQYEQWVDSFDSIMKNGFENIDLKKQLHPDIAVEEKKKELLTYTKKVTGNKTGAQKIKLLNTHEASIDDLKENLKNLEKILESSKGKTRILLKAFYVSKPEYARQTELRVFLYKISDKPGKHEWGVIDWSAPNADEMSIKAKSGAGKTAELAVLNAIANWDKHNNYPKGIIRIEIPSIKGVRSTPILWKITGNGESTTQAIARWFGYLALAGIAIFLALLPIPGSRIASALVFKALLVSTVAGTISSAIMIYDRHSNGIYNPKSDFMDGLSIAANLLGGAGVLLSKVTTAAGVTKSAWKFSGVLKGAAVTGGKAQKWLLVGSITTDGTEAVMIGYDLYVQLKEIAKNYHGTERLLELGKAIGGAAAAGTLLYISYKPSPKFKAQQAKIANDIDKADPKNISNSKDSSSSKSNVNTDNDTDVADSFSLDDTPSKRLKHENGNQVEVDTGSTSPDEPHRTDVDTFNDNHSREDGRKSTKGKPKNSLPPPPPTRDFTDVELAALRETGLSETELREYLDILDDVYFFRGTTNGYAGNSVLQKLNITPASVDPVVATIFALEGKAHGSAVLHFGSRKAFGKPSFDEGNYRRVLEREVQVNISPSEFASKAPNTISASKARQILEDMNIIKLQGSFPNTEAATKVLQQYLNSGKRMSPEQIKEFLKRAT